VYATVVAIAVAGLVSDSRAEETRFLHAAVSPRLATARLMHAADPDEALPMSMTLQLRNRDELAALLTAQQSPGSPDYRHWLSPEAFADRFGPTAAAYDDLVRWLRDRGFDVVTWPSRARVDFVGRVTQVEGAFGVHMNRYSHREREALANADAPALPAHLANMVQHVRLNTFRLAEPLLRVTDNGSPTNVMAPADVYTSYNVASLLAAGIDGTGQTIAVVARSDLNLSDVAAFEQRFGVRLRAPVKIFPASNPGIGSPNSACQGIRNPARLQECILGEETEVVLDTEWASALAPGATVVVDIADTDIDASLADVINHHPEAKVITMSFGACERLDPGLIQLVQPLYAQAAAQGQTMVVSSGDSGPDECGDGGPRSVNGLASDAAVTAVGGTSLDPGFDAAGNATGHVRETVWNDATGATGGGISTLVAAPPYQTMLGVPGNGFRALPDVALLASPETPGYTVIVEDGLTITGGTSVAAPAWAGIIALLNHAAGVDGAGAINSVLYRVGRTQYVGGGLAAYYDVTAGNNSFDRIQGFSAAAGYDPVTGLGTPNVQRLAQAVRSLACPGDCNGDGVVTVDELLAAVNAAVESGRVPQCDSVDTNGDGRVTMDEILMATQRMLRGC